MNTRFSAWTITFTYMCLIYITIPYGRVLANSLENILGKDGFSLTVYVFFLATVCALISVIAFRKRNGIKASFLWLLIISIAYALFLMNMKLAVERIHFLQYGFLGYLVFLALSTSIKDKLIYFHCAAIVYMLGISDELIQWYIPGRFGDFRDIAYNGLAGVLSQLLIAWAIKPRRIVFGTSPHGKMLSYCLAISALTLSLATYFLFRISAHK